MTNEEAINILKSKMDGSVDTSYEWAEKVRLAIKALEQPEIIRCKDCKKHNVKVGFDENFHTVWKEDACPLVDWRGKAKGHEFDYQYCVYAERREGRNDRIN